MKKIILLILALYSTGCFAATAQINNVFKLGLVNNADNPAAIIPTTNLGTVVTLTAEVSSSTANNYLMLMKMNSPGSVGQYQVPSGKKFYALGFYGQAGSANNCVLFGYGTAALVADNTATAPTGNVPYSPAATMCGVRIDVANTTKFVSIPLSFPALSFPYVNTPNSAVSYNIQVVGIEM